MFSWADGRRYHGQWQDGLQHGNGEFHTVKGDVRQGKWINGKFQSTKS
jgi:hypothetical protein